MNGILVHEKESLNSDGLLRQREVRVRRFPMVQGQSSTAGPCSSITRFFTAADVGLNKYFLNFGNSCIWISASCDLVVFFFEKPLIQNPASVSKEGEAFFSKETTPGTEFTSWVISRSFSSISDGVISL